MKALLVIDVQKGLVDKGNFQKELSAMGRVIEDFKAVEAPVIFMQHRDEDEQSPLYGDGVGSDLYDPLKKFADHIIEKQTPSSFFKTDLADTLKGLGINHIFITGFNTEYCCMFTAIAAFDRGYEVTFLEGAAATVNTGETYEMDSLDINDFVGSVLYSSNVIEVLDEEEYLEKYSVNKT